MKVVLYVVLGLCLLPRYYRELFLLIPVKQATLMFQ